MALEAIPSSDMLILLGEFNIRVGSREGSDDLWWHVREPHGVGECNDSGKELLNFLSNNKAFVCMVYEKEDSTTYLAAPPLKEMALHRLRHYRCRRGRKCCTNTTVLNATEITNYCA